MTILDVIKKRRTVQSFASDAISEDKIRTAIEAAIYAPNHKLTWPWLFVWVEETTRRQLAEVQVELKARKGGDAMSSVEREAVIKKFMEPPVLIVAAIKKSDDPNRLEEDYAAMACAIQNMALYLAAENIGHKWGTGGVIADPRTYEILGLNLEEHKICGLLWVGKARVTPPEPKRPPLEKFLLRR